MEAGTYPVEVTADNCKAYTGNITITPDTATHTQTIAMTYLPADYTKVDEAIAKANALNKDAYTDFTAVETAINAVARDKNITEQDEVDAMAQAIENAMAALVEKLNPRQARGQRLRDRYHHDRHHRSGSCPYAVPVPECPCDFLERLQRKLGKCGAHRPLVYL